MTVFRLADDVCAAYPGARIALIVVSGLRADERWPATEDSIDSLERRRAEGAWDPPGEDDPRIAVWHEAYRRFGVNPRRVRPSVDALCRRLARTGRLPRVLGPVDSYNLVSVLHVFPAGAFDLTQVSGDMMIRFARLGDSFTPLSEPGTVEFPRAGAVVYADDKAVLTSYWNHRDADHTKITSTCRSAVFILETLDAPEFGEALARAAKHLAGLVHSHASATRTFLVDPSDPEVMLSDPGHEPAGLT